MLPDDLVGARKAALLVHALPQGARQAVLSQLTGEQRQRMEALLGELGRLAIPGGQDWLSQITDGQPSLPVADGRAALRDAAPAVLADVLEGQPADVVAAVLDADEWAWRDAVLERLPSALRIRVHACREQGVRPTDAVTAILLRECAAALRLRAPEARPAPAPAAGRRTAGPSWFSRHP